MAGLFVGNFFALLGDEGDDVADGTVLDNEANYRLIQGALQLFIPIC